MKNLKIIVKITLLWLLLDVLTICVITNLDLSVTNGKIVFCIVHCTIMTFLVVKKDEIKKLFL
jgi:hypothetical protein